MNKKYFWLVFFVLTGGCDQKADVTSINQKAVDDLVHQSLNNMVDIPGGSFMMGDFGTLIGDKLPLTGNDDDKDVHKVTLSDFSIGKYKVTYKEYDKYSEVNGLKK